MSDVLVRPARAEELPAVGDLVVAAYAVDGLVAPDGYYAGELRDAARRARAAELLVAVDPAERLLGSVTVCPAGTPFAELARAGELEFRMLAVALGARGRGVGELLTRAVLDRARAAGASAVVLSSQRGMAAAHRLYRRLGFVRDPERDWRPVPDVDLLAFRLDLRVRPAPVPDLSTRAGIDPPSPTVTSSGRWRSPVGLRVVDDEGAAGGFDDVAGDDGEVVDP